MITNDKTIAVRAIEDDLNIIQLWRNDTNIRKYFREYRDFSIKQIENWYENMLDDKSFEMFVIIGVKIKMKLLGSLVLHISISLTIC